MAQVSEQFPQLVDFDPVLTEIFYQAYNAVPASKQIVYGMRTSSKAKETDLNIGSHRDPPEFKGKLESHTVDPDFDAEYVPIEFADSFDITRTMRDDLQYESIFSSATEMAIAFARKQEKDGWSTFINAFSSSYLGYDEKALCADDHPRSKTDTTSVDNKSTLVLNSDNLDTAIQQLKGLKDDQGEEISIVPNLLIVPRALAKTGKELTESVLTPESANNAINVHNGLAMLEVPYFSSATAWFVVDTMMSKQKLKWYDRVKVEYAGQEDFNTFIWMYRAYMRYSKGWSNFRFVVGSDGTG